VLLSAAKVGSMKSSILKRRMRKKADIFVEVLSSLYELYLPVVFLKTQKIKAGRCSGRSFSRDNDCHTRNPLSPQNYTYSPNLPKSRHTLRRNTDTIATSWEKRQRLLEKNAASKNCFLFFTSECCRRRLPSIKIVNE